MSAYVGYLRQFVTVGIDVVQLVLFPSKEKNTSFLRIKDILTLKQRDGEGGGKKRETEDKVPDRRTIL